MIDYLKGIFSHSHKYGPWRVSDREVFNGIEYTFEVRYCQDCGHAEFRRRSKEADEPLHTITQMIFELDNADDVGAPRHSLSSSNC